MEPRLYITARLPKQTTSLDHRDLRRARALLPLTFHEGDVLVLLKSLVASTLNFAEVREKILSTVVWCDEAEALVVVEPLHDACFCFQCES